MSQKFELDKYLECLDNNLSSLFETPLIPVNELFELFLATFAKTVNQFAPREKSNLKRKKTSA